MKSRDGRWMPSTKQPCCWAQQLLRLSGRRQRLEKTSDRQACGHEHMWGCPGVMQRGITKPIHRELCQQPPVPPSPPRPLLQPDALGTSSLAFSTEIRAGSSRFFAKQSLLSVSNILCLFAEVCRFSCCLVLLATA